MDLKLSQAYSPALGCDSLNRIWTCWRGFNVEDHLTTLFARFRDGSNWSDEIEVASPSRDLIQPALAADPEDGVHAFWSECREGAWDVYSKRVDADGGANEVNLTTQQAADFAPAATTDSEGRVWVVWQSKREGNFGIWVRHTEKGGGWSDPFCVSDCKSNCWRPAIAEDKEGGVWVGWDAYCNQTYDIYLRHVKPGPSSPAGPRRITTTRSFDIEASVGVDAEGGVWVAWRRSAPWGRDTYYLYPDGQLCLRRYNEETGLLGLPAQKEYTYRSRNCDYGVVPIPVDTLHRELPSLPTLLMDQDGAVHLFYRRFRDLGLEDGFAWHVEHLAYSGSRWTDIETISPEMGYGSERTAVILDLGGEIWTALQGCEFENLWRKRGEASESSVYVSQLVPGEGSREPATIDVAYGTAIVPAPPVSLGDLNHRRKKKGRPSREGFVLAWGDMHRHSLFSPCKPDRDGSLEDHYRWAYDAGEHDFYVTTDHVDCLNRFTWAESNSYADLFNSEGDLVTLFGFESTYPEAEQTNHYFVDREISWRAHHAGLLESLDKGLELYEKEGIDQKIFVARHYHGEMKGRGLKDWHAKHEPMFEVVQARGFCFKMMEAFLAQGLKMGVNGGCDHNNPPGGVMPWKYANAITGVWVSALTRDEVFSALKSRRTYATNGKKITLFLSIDGHPMGEEMEVSEAPEISIRAEGTTEIELVELIRDGETVFSQVDCGNQVDLSYEDTDVSSGEHYYYVKLVQEEEQGDFYKGIAVTSPIWVRKA